jgi:hypothetical protein
MMKSLLLGLNLVADLLHFLVLSLRSRSSHATENLFLRKQLAIYQERGIKPGSLRRINSLAILAAAHIPVQMEFLVATALSSGCVERAKPLENQRVGSVATLKTVREDAASGSGRRGFRQPDRTAGR